MPFGRVQHEYMHLQARRGDLVFDNPYALATEFCYEAMRPLGFLKSQLRAVRQHVRQYSAAAGQLRIEGDLLTIAAHASTMDDASSAVQLDAARVAGIGLAYTESADGCARLATSLAQNAAPALAVRASIDTAVFQWLASSGNQLPYEFAARTWSLLSSGAIRSKDDADLYLGVLLRKAALNRTRYAPFLGTFLMTVQRFRDRDTLTVLYAGAELHQLTRSYPDSLITLSPGTSSPTTLAPALLSRPDPILYPFAIPKGPMRIRLNFHGLSQDNVLRRAVPHYIERIGALWKTIAGEEVIGSNWPVEIGDWPIQSNIDDGVVAIQWTGLQGCEAETYIAYGLPEDAAGATITGAVVTLHRGMNDPDVLGQQLWEIAIGQVGLKGVGNESAQMAVNPLPRSSDLLMMPSYRRYSYLALPDRRVGGADSAQHSQWVCGIGAAFIH